MQMFQVLVLLSMQTFQGILLREISNTLFISVHDSSLAGLGCSCPLATLPSGTKHRENCLHALWVVYNGKNWNLLSVF